MVMHIVLLLSFEKYLNVSSSKVDDGCPGGGGGGGGDLYETDLCRSKGCIPFLVAMEDGGQGGCCVLHVVPAEGRPCLLQESDGRQLAALAQKVPSNGRIELLPLPVPQTLTGGCSKWPHQCSTLQINLCSNGFQMLCRLPPAASTFPFSEDCRQEHA